MAQELLDRKHLGYPKLTPEREAAVIQMYRQPGVRVREIAAIFGISRQTVYNILGRSQSSSTVRPASKGKRRALSTSNPAPNIEPEGSSSRADSVHHDGANDPHLSEVPSV
jgi:transposase-like protein